MIKKKVKQLVLDREIDDGRVLFDEEGVLGKSFNVEKDVTRQLCQLKSFQKVFFVGFIFFLLHSIELRKKSEQRHL